MTLENRIDKLKTRIYITRKSRIEFSESLLEKHKSYSNLQIWYSVIIIFFTLLDDSIKFDFYNITLISSIILLILSVYMVSSNNLEKYHNIKNNYIKLGELEFECNYIKEEKDLKKLEIDYNKSLQFTINHDEYSYLKAILNIQEEIENLKKLEQYDEKLSRFKCLKRKKAIKNLALWSLPFIIYFGTRVIVNYLNWIFEVC